MTYEEIEEQFPDEFKRRKVDKLAYRYPRGESYLDVIARLEPIIIEMERHKYVYTCIYMVYIVYKYIYVHICLYMYTYTLVITGNRYSSLVIRASLELYMHFIWVKAERSARMCLSH